MEELLKTVYKNDELTKADVVWLLQKAYQEGDLDETEISEAGIVGETNENSVAVSV